MERTPHAPDTLILAHHILAPNLDIPRPRILHQVLGHLHDLIPV